MTPPSSNRIAEDEDVDLEMLKELVGKNDVTEEIVAPTDWPKVL